MSGSHPHRAPAPAAPAAKASTPLLVVENLQVAYGGIKALKGDATCRVDRGEIVAMIGANGAGKTTT